MKRIIVFGAGGQSESLLARDMFSEFIIVGFSDNDPQKWGKQIICNGKKVPVIPPNEINNIEFDKILVTLYSDEVFNSIRQQLHDEYGIDKALIKRAPFNKHDGELFFWKRHYKAHPQMIEKHGYQKIMLGIAQEKDDSFLRDKIIADFGCGPQGTLSWATSAKMRIGIDILVPRYLQEFGIELLKSGMSYVTSTETIIPIASGLVDCLFTTNALDHVDHLETMCLELMRILKPGGLLLASFNLHEPFTETEPQTLTEHKLHQVLLKHFDIETYRIARTLEDFHENRLVERLPENERGYLWVRARKMQL